MLEFVQLTDGTDSTMVELTDGMRFALVSYQLQVSVLADSELGTDGPYADSVDQITFHAIGCTASEAYANANDVNDLLDQAWRWRRGQAVNAVKIRLRAQNSTTIVEAIVKGRAPGGPANTALPATWSVQYGKFLIQNITIQVVRRGRLLIPTADTASVAAAAVPTVMTATFATNHPQLSPLRVDFTGAPGTAGSNVIIAVTPNNGQTIVEAESGSLGVNLASVADAANNARGGSVARYTAPASPIATSITLTLSGLNASARRFVVIAAVRKNTAADIFDLSFSFRKVSGAAAILATTETQRISDANTNPQLLIFDPSSMRDAPNSLIVNITPISTAVGRTFDIDYVAVIQVDDNASAILMAAWPSYGPNETISVDPLVTEPTPRVQTIDTGVNFAMTYAGNPAAFGMRGTQAQCTLFAIGGSGTPTKWRMWDSAGAAVAQLGLSLQRQRAYLIPE